MGIEPMTSFLPRKHSATELIRHISEVTLVTGISLWLTMWTEVCKYYVSIFINVTHEPVLVIETRITLYERVVIPFNYTGAVRGGIEPPLCEDA